MTDVRFPILSQFATFIPLETLMSLAPQAAEMIEQDRPVDLHRMLSGQGIPPAGQGLAVRQLAIGFALSARGSLEMERIESVARRTVEAGLGEAMAQAVEMKDQFILGAAMMIRETGYPEGSMEYLDRLVNISRRMEGDFRRTENLIGIAEILSEDGLTDRCRKTYEEAVASLWDRPKKEDINTEAFFNMARRLADIGEHFVRRRLADRPSALLNRLLPPAAKNGRSARGVVMLMLLDQPSSSKTHFRQNGFYWRKHRAETVELLVSAFEEAMAGKPVFFLDDDGWEYDIKQISRISSLIARRGPQERLAELFDRFLLAARKVGDPVGRCRIQKNIAGDLRKLGRIGAARSVMEEAVASAGESRNLDQRIEELEKIAFELIDLEETDLAGKIFEDFVLSARALKSPRQAPIRAALIERAALNFAELGLKDRAREVFEEAIAAVRAIRKRSGRHHPDPLVEGVKESLAGPINARKRGDRRYQQESLIGSLESAGFPDLAEQVRAELGPKKGSR